MDFPPTVTAAIIEENNTLGKSASVKPDFKTRITTIDAPSAPLTMPQISPITSEQKLENYGKLTA